MLSDVCVSSVSNIHAQVFTYVDIYSNVRVLDVHEWVFKCTSVNIVQIGSILPTALRNQHT